MHISRIIRDASPVLIRLCGRRIAGPYQAFSRREQSD